MEEKEAEEKKEEGSAIDLFSQLQMMVPKNAPPEATSSLNDMSNPYNPDEGKSGGKPPS